MKGLGVAFRTELHDLVLSPLVWVGLLASVGAAWAFGTHNPIQENGYLVFQAGLRRGAETASFFLVGIAAVSVAGERTRGTVRWILPRPLSRFGFILGKASAIAVCVLVFLFAIVLVAWLVAVGDGFGDVAAKVEETEVEGFEFFEEEVVPPEFTAPVMRRRTVAAALTVLPALLTATGVGLLVSSLLRSSAAAVIVAFGVVIPLYFAPDILGFTREQAHVLPFRAASDFLEQLRQFGRRFATADWPDYGLSSQLGAVGAVFGLPLLSAALFTRLDLTD